MLFDLDGTLVDSRRDVERVWQAVGSEEGVEVSMNEIHGSTAAEAAHGIFSADRAVAVAARIDKLESEPVHSIAALPGAAQILEALPIERWAIVTSASAAVASARLSAAGLKRPSLLISADQVTHGKPDPEPYRLGMRYSGSQYPSVCVEDTVTGLMSGRAAGCVTIGVPGTTSTEVLREHADYVVLSLSDLQVSLESDHVALTISPT